MDFDFSAKERMFYEEVDEFIRTELPEGWAKNNMLWPQGYGSAAESESDRIMIDQFRHKLAKKGWLTSSWPREYGGAGLTKIESAIFYERMSYHRAMFFGSETLICGPTILNFGTEEMKKEWLPRIASGEVRLWLGYSEPNSGSDLASLQTRAVEDGNDLVITGQKIWSSGAHVIRYSWMAVRTNPSVAAHKGISLVIVDLQSPGVTIRPLVNICGVHHFNEVFFDNVRVPKKNIVGEMNKGWYYLVVALDYERLAVGLGNFKRTFEELLEYVKNTKRGDNCLKDDPFIKKQMADLAIDIETAYMFFWRTASMLDHGLMPNTEASILKLFCSELSHKLAKTAMQIMGPYGQLAQGSKWAPLDGRICNGYLGSIAALVGAGTSAVQRNIIATRGLGLPRS